jgi:hypothetical protein
MDKDYGILYEEVLRKSYDYKNEMFWENFILSNIVRNLPEDIKALGNNGVIQGYVDIFGMECEDVIEYLVLQDIGMLQEASIIAKNGLLFEDYLEPNLKKYLVEKLIPDLTPDHTPNFGTTPMMPGEGMMRKGLAMKAGLGSMLYTAWQKLKSVGRAIFAPIIPYLKMGYGWAKNLVQQGLAWFNKTPWAKVLLPVLLITGSVRVAKRLLNRVRRKKLTRDEANAIKDYATKNSVKINQLRQKAKLPQIKV